MSPDPAHDPASPEPLPPPSPQRSAFWRRPVLLLALGLALLLGWQWYDARARVGDLREDVARRLGDNDAALKETRLLVRQQQEALQALQAKSGTLEAQLAEAQSQQLALEAMYQELSKSRDERLLAEIEQAVSIAAQQLQLAGNVETALIALQGAEMRLARAANARFLTLRKLLARDIERLRALPSADLSGMALKLESVATVIDSLPLAAEQRPLPDASHGGRAGKTPAELSFWQALALDIWSEARQLVRIERVDRPDPGLLTPSQSYFLRENLRLRLASARLALLARDSRSFRNDVRQAHEWIGRHFDERSKPVQAALGTLKGLATSDITLEPPSLAETLGALRNLKLGPERELTPPPSRGGAAR